MKHGDGTCFLDSPHYSRKANEEYLAKWINSQSINEDSFTPMHYAAFFGNLYMIELFISVGGDPFI